MNFLKLTFLLALLLLITFLVPLPISQNTDFFPVWGQIRGMLHGLPFYSEQELYRYLAESFPTILGSEVAPLAQPPWYYALLFFLGYFNLAAAAAIWFALSAFMLTVSALIAAPSSVPLMSGLAVTAAFLFPPAVGHLVVGQFCIPVLLGSMLLLIALEKRDRSSTVSLLAAVGILLCSLKPHIGIVPAFVAICLAFLQDKRFGIAVLWRSVAILLLAVLVTLAIDPGWIGRYPEAMARVAARPQNVNCDTCISLTYAVSQVDSGLSNRWIVGGVFTLLLTVGVLISAFTVRAEKRGGFSRVLLSAALLVPLIASPYVRNYDAVAALPAFLVFLPPRYATSSRLVALLLFCGVFLVGYAGIRGSYQYLYGAIFLGLFLLLLRSGQQGARIS